MREPLIELTCYHCGKSVDETKVEPLGIAEDLQGRDVVWYVCPRCDKRVDSFRYITGVR